MNTITVHNNLAFLANAQIQLDSPYYPRASSPEPLPESSPEPPSKRSISDKQLVCTSCGDQCVFNSFTAVCEHSYCNECLASYVESALQPGETFPPQCCRVPFTLKILRASLSPELVTDYEAKQAKIAAACSLLCAEPGCRVIIPEDKIVDDVGHCPACNRNTYVKCRTAQHEGKNCPTDEERRRVVGLAKDKKCQVCYQCNNMIELNVGCNHMTCLCKAQFCYVRGTPWKRCTCPQFAPDFLDNVQWADDQHPWVWFRRRTIFRAHRSLARYEKHLRQTWGKPDEHPREEQLDEVRAAIETGCDHGYWRRVQTVNKKHPGHYQLCKYVGWKFIFQCEDCPLTSCWACHTDGPPEILLVEEGADAEAR